MAVTVEIPGTCGELVQGQLAGQDFLISLPVNRFSRVTLSLNESGIVSVLPSWCTKVAVAVKKTLQYFGEEQLGAEVYVRSELPVSKGWGSSSADILAAISGVIYALKKKLTLEKTAQLALAIEPTDSIFVPGLAIFDHVKGTRLEPLGAALPIQILACEFVETVDTVSFNNRADLAKLNRAKELLVQEALELVLQGIKERDLQKVARGATISAQAHQQVLYKPFLNMILEQALKYGALGVNIAHSGTTIGILFAKGSQIDPGLVEFLQKNLPNLQKLHHLEAICGGIKVLASGEN